MKVKVQVCRKCYQYQDFEVEVDDIEDIREAAEEMAIEFDWSNNPTDEVEVISSTDFEDVRERLVTVIIGEMKFEDNTCLILSELHRFQAPISTAEEEAVKYIESNGSPFGYQDYVIPELYEGTIL